MQIRQPQPSERYFSPISLPTDFPIRGDRHSPDIGPIRFLHLHDCLEIGYCHEGAGIFVIEDKVLPFSAGDVVVINDREMHLARSASQTGSLWTFLSLDPARLIPANEADRPFLRIAPLGGPQFPNILRGAEHPEVASRVRAVVQELEERRPGYKPAVRGIVWTLLVQLQRLAGVRAEAEVDKRGACERIAPALDHLARHYAEPVPMPKLASLCHTCDTNLRRLFRDATGDSPRNYLTRLRVQMAATLLQGTTQSIVQVAQAVGYATLSSFNRHFRRWMQTTPREWRKRSR
jgi:AraC family transcriptional regulator, activator of mtrCDE